MASPHSFDSLSCKSPTVRSPISGEFAPAYRSLDLVVSSGRPSSSMHRPYHQLRRIGNPHTAANLRRSFSTLWTHPLENRKLCSRCTFQSCVGTSGHERSSLMQSLIRRSIAVVASAGVMTFLMAGGFPLGAQETGAAKSQSSKGKQKSKADNESPAESSGKAKSTGKTSRPDPTHRVPPGFGKLGLTAQQKEAIYKIQGKYYPRIQALEKQVEEMRSKRDAECE